MKNLDVQYGSIMQIAYTVPDIEFAVNNFARQMNIGGWVIIEKTEFASMLYRGKESPVPLKVGIAYQGDMMYEFIQPLTSGPSVYKDTIDSTGYGFHHFAVVVENMDKEIAEYKSRGFELALDVRTKEGARGAYMDTRGKLPGMLEFMEDSGPIRAFLRLAFDIQSKLQGDPNILRV